MRVISIVSLLAVAACGGGGGGSGGSGGSGGGPTPPPPALNSNALFFGTPDGSTTAANGQPFATALSALDDIEGAGVFNVKVVRAQTDWDSGETTFILSDETVTVTELDGGGVFEITLGGETITIDDGDSVAPNANGRSWQAQLNNSLGAVSGTGLLFDFVGAENPALAGEFDAGALFVFGHETDPAEIAALMGPSNYSGDFNGVGQLLDANGSVIGSRVLTSGTVTIGATFGNTASISGTVAGMIEDGHGNPAFNMDFTTDLDGNGYASDLDCLSGCDDNASVIAGAFYGVDALETSGLIGLDITTDVTDPANTGQTIEGRYLGGAGFSATQ